MDFVSRRRPGRAGVRSLVALGAVGVALAAGAGSATAGTAPHTLANWDTADQKTVAAAGILPAGNGAAPLTQAAQRAALRALAPKLAAPAPAVNVPATITVTGFDRELVTALGLSDLSAHIQTAATSAGLAPSSYFGSEVVARALGLRYNHPAADDRLELYPTDRITVAEAAYSYARVLAFAAWQVPYTRQTLAGFALPAYTAAQRAVLRLAVSKIGMPYIWAGESDTAEPATWMWGAQAHGGYDCSGFIWRVYKLSGNPAGATIAGRTAAQMAGEIPKSQRIAARALRPGDILFLGSAGFAGKATESSIIHAGLYLGDNWVIHASAQGVYVLPLQGSWLGDMFAWGRRVL